MWEGRREGKWGKRKQKEVKHRAYKTVRQGGQGGGGTPKDVKQVAYQTGRQNKRRVGRKETEGMVGGGRGGEIP